MEITDKFCVVYKNPVNTMAYFKNWLDIRLGRFNSFTKLEYSILFRLSVRVEKVTTMKRNIFRIF